MKDGNKDLNEDCNKWGISSIACCNTYVWHFPHIAMCRQYNPHILQEGNKGYNKCMLQRIYFATNIGCSECLLHHLIKSLLQQIKYCKLYGLQYVCIVMIYCFIQRIRQLHI
jgi:hypothetical protein